MILCLNDRQLTLISLSMRAIAVSCQARSVPIRCPSRCFSPLGWKLHLPPQNSPALQQPSIASLASISKVHNATQSLPRLANFSAETRGTLYSWHPLTGRTVHSPILRQCHIVMWVLFLSLDRLQKTCIAIKISRVHEASFHKHRS